MEQMFHLQLTYIIFVILKFCLPSWKLMTILQRYERENPAGLS